MLERELAHILALIQTHGRKIVVTNMGSVVYTYDADPLQWILVMLGMADEEMDEEA